MIKCIFSIYTEDSKLLGTECLVELLAEIFECSLFILWLLAELLRHCHDSCRSMGGSTRTISLVDMLATGSLSSHKVKSDIFHVHVELARDFWNDNHDGSA